MNFIEKMMTDLRNIRKKNKKKFFSPSTDSYLNIIKSDINFSRFTNKQENLLLEEKVSNMRYTFFFRSSPVQIKQMSSWIFG